MAYLKLENAELVYSITEFGFMATCNPPLECKCGRMAAMMVNRYGHTRCTECDEKAQAEKASVTGSSGNM